MTNNVPIIFKIAQTLTPGEVWIQFVGGAWGSITGANGSLTLEPGNSYSLAELTSELTLPGLTGPSPNILVSSCTAGRIYVNLGNSGLDLSKEPQPDPANPRDPNFLIPWAYIELNVSGDASNNLDLSCVDFFSLAMEAQSYSNGTLVDGLTFIDSSPDALGQAREALIDVSGGAAAVCDGSSIVRVLSPSKQAEGYHDWSDYFDFLSKQPSATIGGSYSGFPGGSGRFAPQNYCLQATFGVEKNQDLWIVLNGRADVVGNIEIDIKYDDLSSMNGIYGCDAAYTVYPPTSGCSYPHIQNDLYGRIVGDLVAALNYGLLASPKFAGMQTSDMFAAAAKNLSLLFSGAWTTPNPDFYNRYAAQILNMSTDFYGFPFSDRAQQSLLPFPPGDVDYVMISLLEIADPS
ncbi:MAG TPA: beta-1,3-glucanase family protein [Allosphingosinicella sp.]|nr:beta-1,3-glucanase family protein [Allosphingosinicella sp.]